jgi:hypothetical protein
MDEVQCDARSKSAALGLWSAASKAAKRALFIESVVLCWAQEAAMSKAQKPLKPDDFPVNAEGKKIKKQDGTPIASTDDPTVAADVAERLNDDEARREEDKWSA